MDVAASENLAASDIPELHFTFSKCVIQVPIRRLNSFIQQTDFLEGRTPQHDAGTVEPIEDDLREIPIDFAAERFPIPVHRTNLRVELDFALPR
jgi:hypothetical protein